MLSLSRFLFMADRPDLFDPVVIAEMRGVIDERGGSVFWDAIGRHFFEIEFPKADQLSFVNKQFIAELMPHHPIYIPLLPGPAQEVIGQVHEHTRPARRILEQEGFTFSGMVDIFEAGPVMSCQRDQIRTVRESVVTTVGSIIDTPPEGAPRMLARTGEAFRVCLGAVAMDESGKATLSSKSALALGVKVGDSLRVAPLRAATTSKDK